MNDEEFKVIEAMERFGGSFVKELAELYQFADPDNRRKIRETWSEYWKKYREMAKED